MGDEGLLGAGGDVWSQDAGRGADCYIVPGKAQGVWSLQH